MRNVTRKFLFALLTVCLMLSVLAGAVPTAMAETATNETQRYNIMLVIDGSGSLETASKTDPDGMRYELISHLLGNIGNDGHNIGAIVFSGNNGTDSSASAMESGIMLNTGIMSLDDPSPDGRPTKDYIYNQIVKTGYDHTRNGTTDVGTAVRVAQRTLLAKQKENGLESVVLLFTDGVTELRNDAQRKASAKNLSTATSEMSANGIRLMGLFLNKDGKLKSDEIKGIVCAANGITETAPEFEYSYQEIKNASGINATVHTMMEFLGYIHPNPDPEIIYGDLNDTFTIPGVGVEEMNISLYSHKGEALPDMTIELTRPDGTTLSGSDLRAIGRIGRTFHVYKLVAPMPGEWKMHIRVPKGNSVGYCYDPVYSVLIDAGLSTTPDVSEWHVNKDVTFNAFLSQNGTTVTEPAAYREYGCTLVITDKVSGTAETFEIPNDGTGKFAKTLKLDKYGQFEAKVLFTCDELLVESNALGYLLENQAPTIIGTPKESVTYGLFQQNTATIDLSPYFNDREDGKNVTLSVKGSSCPSDVYTLNGTTLEVQSDKLSNDTIDFIVTDSQGATTEFQLAVASHSVTTGLIILGAVILGIIVLIVIVIIIIFQSVKPKGSLTLSFTITDENGGEHSSSVFLGVPNYNAPSNTTLGALLGKALSSETLLLEIDMEQEKAVELLTAELRHLNKIRVSRCVLIEGGKLIGAVKVVSGREKMVLMNKSWSCRPENIRYVLTFTASKKSRGGESELDQLLDTDNSTGDSYVDSNGMDDLFS